MNKSLVIALVLFSNLMCFGQHNLDSLVRSIEGKIKFDRYQVIYLPDSLQQYGCEALVYVDNNWIHKLEMGCGDGTIEMYREHFYFVNNDLVYVISKRFYYNAPPTYTEEVAKSQGAKSGWFDPAKTRIKQSECFFTNGKMTKMIDVSGKEIPPGYTSFDKTETINILDANQAKAHYFNTIKK
jgi:hypothetical protein